MAAIAEVYLTNSFLSRKKAAKFGQAERARVDLMSTMPRVKVKGWIAWGAALFFFSTGSLVTAYLTQLSQARADNARVFQLLVYHAVPGKVGALEARFRDAAALIAEYHLNVVGFWVPNDKPAWDNTFVYLVAHSSREEAKKNWDAFHADPRFQKYVKAEEAEKLIDKVDSTYMRPTDFSQTR